MLMSACVYVKGQDKESYILKAMIAENMEELEALALYPERVRTDKSQEYQIRTAPPTRNSNLNRAIDQHIRTWEKNKPVYRPSRTKPPTPITPATRKKRNN